ncbi:NAD(P)/FAD-dependent oxidoreductase [Sphingopyxis sp. RIFCSPHIGHO2_12_FULL_65_19]|uniref:NAD(P)/FAD-dependent oxidoreductase n=1 Tax=Sphingopyxis sp. RIFCSPHIGHO2_12_FULL_65_19 TaxID=1802172 RepID=UPI0008B5E15F|nr:FAD-dependent oxidoreductase [Sphingopyxis sp. RIFCSPHIGHO2_12_FULL_65_19]OHD06774.1 MAG: FAD-dependent oxidoreductase [Sphingopyxis sp. RIFCSPHIGHO2_12_FULL_65_19]
MTARVPPADIGSYWLASCDDDLTPRPALTGDATVDVAIMGGGFTGLWTAYYLLRDNPDLSIAIVERQFCGFGASGRNGGWCSPRFPINPAALTRRFGAATARSMLLAQQAMVDDVGRICDEEGIDAHFRSVGVLTLARSARQLPSLQQSFDAYARLGMGDGCELLGASQAQDAVHATQVHGGMRLRAGGTIHPGRLVRGLARALERRGVRIYEGTEVLQTAAGIQPALITSGGTIRARRAVVLAGEAYMTAQPAYRRRLIPMASTIMLTAPLTAAQWDRVGWSGGECLSSYVHTTNYLTRTADGRILFGSRGAPYRYGSDMDEVALRENANFGWIRDRLTEWWPALDGIEFTHRWAGYLGIPRDWLPTVHFDPVQRIGYSYGYTGHGVISSAICARALAGLIVGRAADPNAPYVRAQAPNWEVEPLRWAGIRYVQNAYLRMDVAEAAKRPPPLDAGLAKFLGEP